MSSGNISLFELIIVIKGKENKRNNEGGKYS